MNRSRELTKKTLIITIGKVSTQFVTFLLLPLYTTLLSTEEYGTVDLITTLIQLLIPIVSLMIDQSVFRYLLNCETDINRKRTISSAFFILLGLSAVTGVIYFMLAVFISSTYKVWLVLILIATAFSNLFLQVARGDEMPALFHIPHKHPWSLRQKILPDLSLHTFFHGLL